MLWMYLMINPLLSLKLRQNVKNPIFSTSLSVKERSGKCFACGESNQVWNFANVINNELSSTWELDKTLRLAFDARESMFCPKCGCSFRLRLLAEAIADLYSAKSLKDFVENHSSGLDVAEINSCGLLHQFLEDIPNLKYSEYGSSNAEVPSEDLENLSYKDASLDLILTSDTLEHVPNFTKAIKEIHRVLKPGGIHVFTIPTIWYRVTRKRAVLSSSGVSNLLEPSYHGEGQPDYLVFNEFGYDTINEVKELGFMVQVYKLNLINLSDTSGVFIIKKLSN